MEDILVKLSPVLPWQKLHSTRGIFLCREIELLLVRLFSFNIGDTVNKMVPI